MICIKRGSPFSREPTELALFTPHPNAIVPYFCLMVKSPDFSNRLLNGDEISSARMSSSESE